MFNETEIINVLDQGDFESYANRDSLSYISSYGLEKIDTMYRGTLRKVGFSRSWNSFIKLGMTNDEHIIKDSETLSYFNFMDKLVPKSKTKSLEERFCEFLSINIVSKEFKKYQLRAKLIFSQEIYSVYDIIISNNLSERLNLNVGKIVTFIGSTMDGGFTTYNLMGGMMSWDGDIVH